MDYVLIESDQALVAALRRYAGHTVVAVDTEFMRQSTFYPQVALLQLCFDEESLLIDPLAITDTSPIAALFRDEQVLKVLHSASEDLEVFQRWLGLLPEPLFDTQRAAALLDLGFSLGYRALVQQLLEVDLPKGETRSDWLARPLRDSQCHYAAQDVVYLRQVFDQLHDQCQASDKLEWVLADGRDALATAGSDGGGFYRKVRSAWKLSPKKLAVLDAITRWREETA